MSCKYLVPQFYERNFRTDIKEGVTTSISSQQSLLIVLTNIERMSSSKINLNVTLH